MFARVLTFTGATNIDGGVELVHDQVVPIMREQNGFRGVTVSADRSGGVLGVLSLWETAADRDASQSALAKVREEAQTIVGGDLTVEAFEQVVLEVDEPPVVGSSLLIRRISMDPAKVDENIDFFKRDVVPQIKAGPGFRAVRNMINRETGDGMVGTVWTDKASMEAAAAAAESRRPQAEGRVTFGAQSQREILLAELP